MLDSQHSHIRTPSMSWFSVSLSWTTQSPVIHQGLSVRRLTRFEVRAWRTSSDMGQSIPVNWGANPTPCTFQQRPTSFVKKPSRRVMGSARVAPRPNGRTHIDVFRVRPSRTEPPTATYSTRFCVRYLRAQDLLGLVYPTPQPSSNFSMRGHPRWPAYA